MHTYPGSWGTRYRPALGWLSRAVNALGAIMAGEVQLPGVSAPRSPRLDDQRRERETWSDAARFAGLPGV